MKLHHWLMVAVAFCFAGFLVAIGCTRDLPTESTSMDEANAQTQGNPFNPVVPNKKKKKTNPDEAIFFKADLAGENEVLPVESDATGMAHFVFADNEIRFALFAKDIVEATQSHIHLAPEGSNGQVVAFLKPIGVNFTGTGLVAEGIITSADLVGPLAGEGIHTLINEMRAGNTYVNVHTVAWPGGEIRGQISQVSGDPAKKKTPPKKKPPKKK